MHGHGFAHRGLQRAPDHHLGAQRVEQRGVGAGERISADGRGLEQRVAAARDRGQVEHRVALQCAVISQELAIGAFRLHVSAGVEIALQHPFGIGRHADVVGHAFHHRQRRVAQRGDEPELVDRQPHDRGDVIDRMRADDEAHRQRLAGGGARLVDRAQIARRHQVDAGLVAAAQHQPAHAHIGPCGLGIDDVVDRGGDVGPAVGAMAEMHRQRGEIGVVAGEHDLLHRRLGAATPRRCSGLLRSRRSSSGSSAFGATPKARAIRARLPVTLPTSSWRSGPTARNSTALGLPSRMAATSARSVGSLHGLQLVAQSRRRNGATGSGRNQPMPTMGLHVSFQRCPFA